MTDFCFDISFICMFSFSNEKYIKSAENFSKFGLLNLQTSKVELNALVSKNDLDKFEKIKCNFNQNIDIKIWSSHSDIIREKIYTYLQDNFIDLQSNRRWVMQVDDDSSTDVNNLLNILDFYYDCTDPILLTSCKVYEDGDNKEELTKLFKKYIKKPEDHKYMFLDKKFINRLSGNTWETAIISHGALNKIFKTINTVSFFDDFKKIKFSTHGDRWFDYLGYLCKIPTIISPILSHFNFIDNFSLNGGNICHIHYLNDKSYGSLLLLDYINEFVLNKKVKIFYEDTKVKIKEDALQEFPEMIFLEHGQINVLNQKNTEYFVKNFSRWAVNGRFFYIVNNENKNIIKFEINDFYRKKIPNILLLGEFTEINVDEKLVMRLF